MEKNAPFEPLGTTAFPNVTAFVVGHLHGKSFEGPIKTTVLKILLLMFWDAIILTMYLIGSIIGITFFMTNQVVALRG